MSLSAPARGFWRGWQIDLHAPKYRSDRCPTNLINIISGINLRFVSHVRLNDSTIPSAKFERDLIWINSSSAERIKEFSRNSLVDDCNANQRHSSLVLHCRSVRPIRRRPCICRLARITIEKAWRKIVEIRHFAFGQSLNGLPSASGRPSAQVYGGPAIRNGFSGDLAGNHKMASGNGPRCPRLSHGR